MPRLLATFALPLILAGEAAAQDDPPMPGVMVTISASENKRVRGLTYDATLGQVAQFSFSVPAPQGGAQYVHWEIDDNLVTAAENSLTCPYAAVGMGRHTIKVKVLPNKGAQEYGSLTFAAIGGPLMLAAKPQQNNPETFTHDQGNEGNPIYLQYFDYGHASPPTDSHIQRTQDGIASVALGQPGTTTMTWSYGTLRCPELVANPSANLSSITLQAESAAASPITVKCHFHYDDGAGLSGDADDDTSSTPQNSMANAPMMVNQASVHRPKNSSVDHLVTAQNVNSNLSDYVAYNPGYFALTDYFMRLDDQNGGGMPGVWVQERFASTPPGITINGNSSYWTTEMPSVGVAAGLFDASDEVSYYWTTPVADFSADHTYWAATQYIDLVHTPPGIATGTCGMTWTCSLYPHQVPKS